MGLTRLEIEAIKARGVGQLLQQLEQALQEASPPDLTEAAERTRKAWAAPLTEEAAATTEVLLNTLEPYQAEIEHHFTVEGQRQFRGIMAGYLHLVNRMHYFGAGVRDRIPFLPKPRDAAERTGAWDADAVRAGVQRRGGQPPTRRPRQGAGEPPAGGGRRPGLRPEGAGRPGGGRCRRPTGGSATPRR